MVPENHGPLIDQQEHVCIYIYAIHISRHTDMYMYTEACTDGEAMLDWIRNLEKATAAERGLLSTSKAIVFLLASRLSLLGLVDRYSTRG